jgi:5'-deoxynucleotidase YfbR-like HD superfamily hydrolase
LYSEFEKQDTPEGLVAHDADQLELAIQAKCYLDIGYDTKSRINGIRSSLKTNAARELLDIIERTNMNQWWRKILH